MKPKMILVFTALFSAMLAFGQRSDIELTFTAVDSTAYVQLDSIKIMNRSQGGDTVLYYPDTVLVLDYQVGIPEANLRNEAFRVFQNYPNPVAEQTTVSLYVPEKDHVSIMVTDILGRIIVKSKRVLDKGKHIFRFIPGGGKLYFFTATWQGRRSSIKILQNNPGSGNTAALEYIRYESSSSRLKATKDILSFPFSLGDTLLYIGYSDTLQSGMLDSPEEIEDYTFQFATNIPCLGTPTVEYEGQVYNTIQIFSQCWLKENLNVGTMIPGSENMADNDTIEKYCYDNDPDSCTKYGGLYQWDEMMQYTTYEGAPGICPPGWHLPTDEEWKVLEGAADSQYGIGNTVWDADYGFRGYDAGKNLKTTNGWNENGSGTDLFGFSGMPGGCHGYYKFSGVGRHGSWWTSIKKNSHSAYAHGFFDWRPETARYSNGSNFNRGDYYSVRCLRYESFQSTPEVETGSIFNITHSSAEAAGEIFYLGSSDIIQHGHCWSLEQNPTIEDFKTELGSTSTTGEFTSDLTGLEEETTYYVKAYATNSEGTSYGDEVIFTTGDGLPCPGMPTVTDIDGNTYNTVQIGDQCWIKENLKTTTYNNSTPIPNVTDPDEWLDLTTGAYVWYENDISWKDSYGALYNWFSTVDSNGLCPTGWHVPTDDEWTTLTDYIGGTGSPHGNKLKSCRQVNSPLGGGCNTSQHPRWNEDNYDWGTDDYGFSGLPGGDRPSGGMFHSIGYIGYWWSFTEFSSGSAWGRGLGSSHGNVEVTYYLKGYGFAVRCLRN